MKKRWSQQSTLCYGETKILFWARKWGLFALRHGIQISMEAILACHPARSTEWLNCHPKSCELWRIRTGPIPAYRLFLNARDFLAWVFFSARHYCTAEEPHHSWEAARTFFIHWNHQWNEFIAANKWEKKACYKESWKLFWLAATAAWPLLFQGSCCSFRLENIFLCLTCSANLIIEAPPWYRINSLCIMRRVNAKKYEKEGFLTPWCPTVNFLLIIIVWASKG